MENKAIIITGPIGSGKSTALSIIKELGFNTVDLDVISGDILKSDESKEFLMKNFPTSIVNNEISKKIIAEIVFKDRLQLEKLENYLHPKIMKNLNQIINDNNGITFIEVSAPKNIHKDFKTLVIWSSQDDRVERLKNRNMEIDDIRNRIKFQPNDDWWLSIGTVIKNDNLDQLEVEIKNFLDNHSK
tara:strand:+ start:604 stop:1164 length:561 start_codon:yes stop_codon:yes gene_type:complete